MRYLLGYEIGSDKVKAALLNAETSKVIATEEDASVEMLMLSLQKGWAEQDPKIWWKHLCACTKELIKKAKIDPKEIISIGIAYQMHGLVLLDHNCKPLRPSIIWCDNRAVGIGETAMYDLGIEFCFTNLLNSPGNFTASKLKWIKDNEPDLFRRIYKIMLPGDYIAYKLTGELTTTISGLSEGIFWNFKERKVSKDVLDYFGFDEAILPTISKTFDQHGALTKKAAKQTGLAKGIPVTYRAGDQPNNALSLNVLNKGEIAITSSNSGVVYGVVEHLMSDTKSRINSFAHVNYEEDFRKIGILLCLNGAGSLYSWVKHNVARPSRDYEDMERILSSVPIGSDGVCILPFGNGSERIFNNKNIDAHIHNIQFNKHSRAHIYRASIEGVAFAFVYGLQLLKEMGLDINEIRVGSSDMFQSRVFTNTISTLLGKEIQVMDTSGSIGAALASGVGVGVFKNIKEAVSNIAIKRIQRPRMDYVRCSQAYNYWLSILKKTIIVSEQPAESLEKANKLRELNAKLEQKSRLIEGQALDIRESAELKEKIISMANRALKSQSSVEIEKTLSKVVDLLKTNNTYNRELLEDHLDILNETFIKRLMQAFPSLSFEELKMSYYIRSQFSTKEIASRMSLSLRGAETKRYRLRRKLGLDRETNLSSYIRNL